MSVSAAGRVQTVTRSVNRDAAFGVLGMFSEAVRVHTMSAFMRELLGKLCPLLAYPFTVLSHFYHVDRTS